MRRMNMQTRIITLIDSKREEKGRAENNLRAV